MKIIINNFIFSRVFKKDFQARFPFWVPFLLIT
jgi:hypothetical protein